MTKWGIYQKNFTFYHGTKGTFRTFTHKITVDSQRVTKSKDTKRTFSSATGKKKKNNKKKYPPITP